MDACLGSALRPEFDNLRRMPEGQTIAVSAEQELRAQTLRRSRISLPGLK